MKVKDLKKWFDDEDMIMDIQYKFGRHIIYVIKKENENEVARSGEILRLQ